MRLFHDTLTARVYMLMVGVSFGLGAVVLGGDPRRFSGPSFEGPRHLVQWVPGWEPHQLWGALFLLHAIIMVALWGRTTAVHALRFGMVVFWFLAIAFATSVATVEMVRSQPAPALTAVVMYTGWGTLYLLVSDYLSDRGWGT